MLDSNSFAVVAVSHAFCDSTRIIQLDGDRYHGSVAVFLLPLDISYSPSVYRLSPHDIKVLYL